MISTVATPSGNSRGRVVAMVHVHSTSALLNHCQAAALGVAIPTATETSQVNDMIGDLNAAHERVMDRYPVIAQVASRCRSAALLLDSSTEAVVERFAALPFVCALVKRAREEVAVYVKCGIKIVEIENVVAPYFIGPGVCPWEEILILHVVARAVREDHPSLVLGMHILSCNELEVLPLALASGAFFVRSEATLFQGLRPEGPTENNANLARFLYVRRALRQLAAPDQHPEDLEFPHIWSDVQKKHTVFAENLMDTDVWLNNINFMKIEGVIATGAETGSDVDESLLRQCRQGIDRAGMFFAKATKTTAPVVPLITGSGTQLEMYAQYADFMIVGSLLKAGGYWENPVDEAQVRAVMARVGPQ